jgi:hypothetical protein
MHMGYHKKLEVLSFLTVLETLKILLTVLSFGFFWRPSKYDLEVG